MKDDFPEAPAIAYTGIKTKNGYHWSFTMRTKTVGELIDQMETMEEIFKDKGWEAEEIRSNGFKKKEVEYVKDQSGNPYPCPMCKVGHIKIIKSPKGTFYGCDMSKFDPLTKTYGGCKYFSTTDPSKTPQLKQEDLDVPEDF